MSSSCCSSTAKAEAKKCCGDGAACGEAKPVAKTGGGCAGGKCADGKCGSGPVDAEAQRAAVRAGYEKAQELTTGQEEAVHNVAQGFGYSVEELQAVPEANMGLACGNPVALASLRPGEVALDLGAGGGLDVFLAAQRVGPTGLAIGVDMTPSMVARARASAAKRSISNVSFRLGECEHLPVADATVDCVISNCVINLVADKAQALREVARVLRPGGRIAISDVVLRKPDLPPSLRTEAALVGCIAGAIPLAEYRAHLEAAGLADIVIADAGSDLNVWKSGGGAASADSGCCGAQSGATQSCCPGVSIDTDVDINEWCMSAKIMALKPKAA